MSCDCMGLNCGECRKTIPFPTSQITQPLLRALRLWHWTHFRRANGQAQNVASGRLAEIYREEATFHMRAVQTLNDFFAIGDTAQRDHDRQEAA